MTLDLNHITPAHQMNARLSDEQRIEWIRTDRWIQYPRAESAISRFEDLMSYPPRDRMPCLLLYGDTGMGKTMIVRKFTRDHPPAFNEGTGTTTMPVVSVQMPPEPNERDFYDELLRVMGAPRRPQRDTLSNSRHLCRRLLSELGARLLIIDEVHSLLAGTFRQQRVFINTIRFLSNDLRIPLICCGIDEARHALLSDQQLANRFDAFELPRWNNDTSFQRLLASFEKILPLRNPSNFSNLDSRSRILDMTGGVTVQICRLIETVAVKAIKSGKECIDLESFTSNDLSLPLVSMTERSSRRRGKTA
jgi:hypothetical protein